MTRPVQLLDIAKLDRLFYSTGYARAMVQTVRVVGHEGVGFTQAIASRVRAMFDASTQTLDWTPPSAEVQTADEAVLDRIAQGHQSEYWARFHDAWRRGTPAVDRFLAGVRARRVGDLEVVRAVHNDAMALNRDVISSIGESVRHLAKAKLSADVFLELAPILLPAGPAGEGISLVYGAVNFHLTAARANTAAEIDALNHDAMVAVAAHSTTLLEFANERRVENLMYQSVLARWEAEKVTGQIVRSAPQSGRPLASMLVRSWTADRERDLAADRLRSQRIAGGFVKFASRAFSVYAIMQSIDEYNETVRGSY